MSYPKIASAPTDVGALFRASLTYSMFRLGVVSFLNALPLYATLRAHPDIEISPALPARLADGLSAGIYDAALMPVVDHLRGVGDGLLGDAIVGATGRVESVMLFSNVEIEKAKSIALDTSSHSSVALTTIIARDFYGLNPQMIHHAPDVAAMLRVADAALLIGDPALIKMQDLGDLQVYDLAAEWKKFTGLSFIFAAWAAREGLENRDELTAILNRARDDGKAKIAQLVAAESLPPQLSPAIVENYLANIIEHTRTPSHSAGLDEFARRLAKLDLL